MTREEMIAWDDLEPHPVTLVIIDEEEQEQSFMNLSRELVDNNISAGVVCLNHSASMILDDFSSEGISTKGFFFMDGASTSVPGIRVHSQQVDAPHDLKNLRRLIQDVTAIEGCKTLLVDSLSSLLISHEKHDIFGFANTLRGMTSDGTLQNIIFFSIRADGFSQRDAIGLFRDLEMIVDHKVVFPTKD